MTPPGRAVGPLDSLAPDQRAVLELVVRQGRSYAELADLLGIPEAAVRERAHAALEALAPDLAPPRDAGELADFLLRQQDGAAAARTRARLAADTGAQRWAMTVGAPLGELAPADAAARPARADSAAAGAAAAAGDLAAIEDVELPAPRPAARRPTGRTASGTATASEPPATEPPAGRSSRLGGAILIGAAIVAVAAVLIFVLTRGGSDHPSTPAAATTTPTAAADQLGPDDVVLRGPAGSRAVGLMRLFTTKDKKVHFLLAGQSVPPNRKGERYALWFLKQGKPPIRLGFASFTVGKAGSLAMAGPQSKDLASFPKWFVAYDTVAVTDDGSASARRPGTVILAGSLPRAGG
jgi:Sigma-70, region 4